MVRADSARPQRVQDGSATASHPDSVSTARAMRNSAGSSNGRPTSCTEIGNPSAPSPTGTLIAGCPVTLNGIVCIGEAVDSASTGASKRGAVASVEAVSSAS